MDRAESMADHLLDTMEIWHPNARISSGSQRIEFNLDLVATNDSVPLDQNDYLLPQLVLREFGFGEANIDSWELKEFASPYYGEDPISENFEWQIGRAWHLSFQLFRSTAIELPIQPERHRRLLKLPDTLLRQKILNPLENLPLISIGESRSDSNCQAILAELPAGTVTTIRAHGLYTQIRVAIDTYPGSQAGAMDHFVDLCDKHDVSMHWRDFISLWNR